MHELIITEKPSSAKKIAEALADSKPIVDKASGVNIFKITHKKKDIVVVSAVGHLYSLTEKEKGFTYPSFDIHWQPSHEVDQKADYSKKYLNVIKKLSKDASEIIVACDYDVEGEVIGLNIVRYACSKKDASRMKFSTLTKDDLIESYDKRLKTLDWGQATAGETRHFLDWLYGINLSRALTLAIKKAGRFKIMSSGRVQGPALKIVVDKEKEIRAFKPEPYWQIILHGTHDKQKIEALHEKDKFFDKKEAAAVYEKVKPSKKAKVAEIKKNKFKQAPPNPFDLGSLQSEAYKLFKIQPKQTLQIAQNLYLAGVTSYPRTSSQQIPPELGYKKLLSAVGKNPKYEAITKKVLSMSSLKPNNGKKTDPAHPAIYPTGLIPSKITQQEEKVYDLIVKRFVATFGEDAERETVTAKFDVNSELFITKGTRTTIPGWHVLYEPYVKLKDEEFPSVSEGGEIKVTKINMEQKETLPPKRYTPASIISELEKRGLGTKATRADIIEALYNRGYILDKSIEATELGIKVESTLEKHVPEILDEELTRKFEEEMDLIREKKNTQQKVLDEAKLNLTKLLNHFKKEEAAVGEELLGAQQETQDAQNHLGPCPVCKEGTITIKKGKFGYFAACTRYPDCNATFNLPKGAYIKPTGQVSPMGYPIIAVARKGKGMQELSLNPAENNQGISEEKIREMQQMKAGKLKKTCPQCSSPLTVRSSIYGEFIACTNYPKCKFTESNGKAKEEKKDETES